MEVPLWLVVSVVAVLGIKLIRPPWWLVALLLLGGYFIADSFLSPAVDHVIK